MYLRMIPAFVHSILPMGFLDMGNAYDKIKTLSLANKIPRNTDALQRSDSGTLSL